MKPSLKHLIAGSVILGIAILAVSCMRQPRYVVEDEEQLDALKAAWAQRKDFPPLNQLDFYIPVYAQYLKGLKICLDPGHGGDADRPRYKRGPTDYREAVMNWKIANYLKDFLEQCGAEVKLTRDGDVEVSLAERDHIANEWGADLFLSIHHNAGPPRVNRTTVWFHMDPDLQPANCDMARYIVQGVVEYLRLPQCDGVPLKSDRMMYDTGFGVLRRLKMVGCLSEGSFFTNPYEEWRLKQDWYLKREAYGLFLGLAKYAWMGIPKARLLQPAPDAVTTNALPLLILQPDTGLTDRPFWGSDRAWLFSESVAVTLDGVPLTAAFDNETSMILAQVEKPLEPGEHVVMGRFRNYNGNHSHPLKQVFTYMTVEEWEKAKAEEAEKAASAEKTDQTVTAEATDRTAMAEETENATEAAGPTSTRESAKAQKSSPEAAKPEDRIATSLRE